MLLPAGWQGWPRHWVAAALAHEAAHVARGDLRWQLLVRALRPLFWFHPGVWLASRRLSDEAEAACDERAVDGGLDRLAYAEALVQIAASVRSARLPAPALAAAHGGPSLLRRVRLLLGPEAALRRSPRLAWVAGLVFAAPLLATGELGRAGALRRQRRGCPWNARVESAAGCCVARHRRRRLRQRHAPGDAALARCAGRRRGPGGAGRGRPRRRLPQPWVATAGCSRRCRGWRQGRSPR